jgi:hypothetical protein
MIRNQSSAGISAMVALGIALVTGACATTPKPELTIHESDKGSVYLARVSDRAFQAAHPIKLEPPIITRVLRGVYVLDKPTTIGAIITTKPITKRALSDEEIAFLSPLISTAFVQASADQQIGFSVISTGTPFYSTKVGAAVGSSEPPLSLSPQETTSGLLYAYGQSLHVSLTQYRHRPQKPDMIAGPNRYYPDPTGITTHDIVFLPAEAIRPDSYKQPNFSGDPDATTFVIDYQTLASLPEPQIPAPAAAPASPPAVVVPHAASELEAVKESMSKKDAEVEALKKEMEAIKKQLGEQQKSAQPKRKSKPAN